MQYAIVKLISNVPLLESQMSKVLQTTPLGFGLVGLSYSHCYLIEAQQFGCAIAMVCRTPLFKAKCTKTL
jgi:hypothetical protein